MPEHSRMEGKKKGDYWTHFLFQGGRKGTTLIRTRGPRAKKTILSHCLQRAALNVPPAIFPQKNCHRNLKGHRFREQVRYGNRDN